jgi:integrase
MVDPAAPTATDPVPQIRDTGVPYTTVLNEMLAGKTRFDIVAAYPVLVPDDIPTALDIAKTEVMADRLPPLARDGVPLSVAEVAGLRASEAMSERLEDLIYRYKRNDLIREERVEMEDIMRFEHVMTLAKAKARGKLSAGR